MHNAAITLTNIQRKRKEKNKRASNALQSQYVSEPLNCLQQTSQRREKWIPEKFVPDAYACFLVVHKVECGKRLVKKRLPSVQETFLPKL